MKKQMFSFLLACSLFFCTAFSMEEFPEFGKPLHVVGDGFRVDNVAALLLSDRGAFFAVFETFEEWEEECDTEAIVTKKSDKPFARGPFCYSLEGGEDGEVENLAECLRVLQAIPRLILRWQSKYFND